MPTLKIDFNDNDTTPERIAAMASDYGLTSEQLVKRAIAEFLGEYGLKEPPEDFAPQNLRELFTEVGLMKKPNK